MCDNCKLDLYELNSCFVCDYLTGCEFCNDILIYKDVEMCVRCWSWWIMYDGAFYCRDHDEFVLDDTHKECSKITDAKMMYSILMTENDPLEYLWYFKFI